MQAPEPEKRPMWPKSFFESCCSPIVQSVETAKPRLDPMLETLPQGVVIQDDSSYVRTGEESVRQSAQGAIDLKNAPMV
jgi:hypothetical protein